MATIKEQLENLAIEQLIPIWNDYASNCCMDDYVYANEDYQIDELFRGQDPSDIIRNFLYGDYRNNDTYFCFDGYANICSFCWETESNCPIDLDILSEYINDNREDFASYDLHFSCVE